MNYNFIIEKKDVNKRLDVFLEENLTDVTRSYISNMNKKGNILVNGKMTKNGYKLVENDKIDLELEERQTLSANPENIELDIVFENENLIVINKPQGMVVHPAVGNYNHTLVNALMYKFANLSEINGEYRAGIVHRLDKDTSGLMVVAKNNKAHIDLAKQIETKTCKRKYLALVVGSFKEREGKIEKNLIRSKKNRLKYEVCPEYEGKPAITLYKTLEVFKGYSLVEFELKTGRTHQIRVHSSYLGHPIVGDKLYGIKDNFNLDGQLLTAYKIEFCEPSTKENLSFEIGLPDYFLSVLSKLRNQN